MTAAVHPLLERIDADLRQAMRQKDEVVKLTLRSVKTALTEAAKSAAGEHPLGETEVVAVVGREAKRRRDAIAEYKKAGRLDLAAQEQAELAILEQYLPRQYGEAEIEALARAAIAESGATSVREMGKIMALLMPQVTGLADGGTVNQVVRRLLA